jgi:hypothetical protein
VGEDRPVSGRRLTVDQAATTLGISADAVRSRIKRGTLTAERSEEGRVWVLLGADRPSTRRDQPTDQPTDQPIESDVLISEMRARIESLEHQLELERDANRENRRLLAAALERIPPAIEAPRGEEYSPSEARESPETATQQSERVKPQPAAEGSHGGTSGPWLGLLHEAGTTAVTTLVAQAVGSTVAAFSAVQGELRITLYIFALQVLVLAGAYLYVRRQSARTPVPEGEGWLKYHRPLVLVLAGSAVALLVFVILYYGYTATPGWVGAGE